MRFVWGALCGLACGLLLGQLQDDERAARARRNPDDPTPAPLVDRAPQPAPPHEPAPPVDPVDVARLRSEIETQPAPFRRGHGADRLAAVARHGSEADLCWLESLAASDARREQDVDLALAEGAANPLAALRLAERLVAADRPLASSALAAFARNNPEAAFDAAERALAARTSQRKRLLELLGRAVTASTLPRARAVIDSMPPGAWPESLRAVDLMRRRGLDTSDFVDTVRAPVIWLDAYRAGDDLRPALRALQVLRRNRVAWSDSARGALRALAERGDPALANQAQLALAQLER